MVLRKLTRHELRGLISPCKQLEYALDVLDKNPPPPEPYSQPLREDVLAKVRECATQWMRGQVLDEELDKSIVGFCYLVRLYPEHPAFDSLRDSVARGELQAALRKIGDTYACKFSPCVVIGAELYVVTEPWKCSTYDPLYLSTLGRLEPRLKEIGVKVLGDAFRAICMVPAEKKRVPQHQHWAIGKMVRKLYNYAHDFYYFRD